MTIEETLRSGAVHTAENGFVYGIAGANGHDRGLPHLVQTVPRTLVPRLGRSACYFVPFLYKQRRSVLVGLEPAAEGENRKELCHHLDVKPSGNLLLISLNFYEHDDYGLAMEFFDKVAYLAALDPDPREDFEQLLRRQMEQGKPGELTQETWEWRQALAEAKPEAAAEAWRNYARAAQTDALGLYMAALYTDVFYEDLFEPGGAPPPLAPAPVAERVRLAERLYPANRGFNLQLVHQRPRRRSKETA
ncbi:MAG: hypothetical protein ACRD01_01240 [Terriglobales bacterium]